jgi:succinate-acetate transporter protein
METQTNVTIQDTTANPAPLGLFGFGMTTVLLNLHNAGIYELSSMILAMGIFYGGIAQVIAGVLEMKKKNTFGATAFVSYGFFWLTWSGCANPKLGWAGTLQQRHVALAIGAVHRLHVRWHAQTGPCSSSSVPDHPNLLLAMVTP